jgi:hypothetical protein
MVDLIHMTNSYTVTEEIFAFFKDDQKIKDASE